MTSLDVNVSTLSDIYRFRPDTSYERSHREYAEVDIEVSRHVQKVRCGENDECKADVDRFSPKEDVSGSTSLKSSVQRHIRTSLLEQYPLLSLPAYREASADPTPAPAPVEDAEDASAEKEEVKEDTGGGKKKGGKGKGGGGKKGGKKDKKEKEEEAEEAGEGKEDGPGLLIDDIWPKKESLGLTKWYVLFRFCMELLRYDADGDSHDRISIYTINSVPLFFNHFDGPFIPTIKLLHKCESPSPLAAVYSILTVDPALLPHVQIDRGAIKFLLAVRLVEISLNCS